MDQLKENTGAFTDEQQEEIVDIIGDALRQALDEDEDAHHAEIMQAALDICTFLGGSSVFAKMSLEMWRVTHEEEYEKAAKIARKYGISVGQVLFDGMLSKIARLLGIKYPPYELP